MASSEAERIVEVKKLLVLLFLLTACTPSVDIPTQIPGPDFEATITALQDELDLQLSLVEGGWDAYATVSASCPYGVDIEFPLCIQPEQVEAIIAGCKDGSLSPQFFPELCDPADDMGDCFPCATPEVKITETAIFTLEPTVSCPPALFSRMTVGHIPGLDIGNKKSPVVVSINCSVIAILFDGAKITGVLSEDGRVILNCQMSYDGKVYPCELQIPVLAMDNPYLQANGWMFKKASKEIICLAERNTSYAGFCE